jgi:hypothetical protein
VFNPSFTYVSHQLRMPLTVSNALTCIHCIFIHPHCVDMGFYYYRMRRFGHCDSDSCRMFATPFYLRSLVLRSHIRLCLPVKLHRARSQVAFSKTAGILSKVMVYSVETGLLTSVTAFTELILWLKTSHENWHYIL